MGGPGSGRRRAALFEIGERIGSLVVLEAVKGGRWKLRCDCGETVTRQTSELTRNRRFCSLRCRLYCEMKSKPDFEARRVLERVRSNAKRARAARICTLTIEDIKRIRIGARCHYCDADLPFGTACLDRVDNAGHYTPDNVVPCCPMCNDARGHLLTYEEFRAAMDIRIVRTGPGRAWDGHQWRSALATVGVADTRLHAPERTAA